MQFSGIRLSQPGRRNQLVSTASFPSKPDTKSGWKQTLAILILIKMLDYHTEEFLYYNPKAEPSTIGLRHHHPPFPNQSLLAPRWVAVCGQSPSPAPPHLPQCWKDQQQSKATAKFQSWSNPLLTCFRGPTLSCCVSRSTSWVVLSSCLCGWRAKAATGGQQRHNPSGETRGEASPTQFLKQESLSSHRGLLLSCISL